MEQTKLINFIAVTPENVADTGIFCIKDKKAAGFKAKVDWFKQKMNGGLVIKIAVDENRKQLGFIEYIPSELAWRPVKAKNYLFVQCIAMFSKEAREKGAGSLLLNECVKDAAMQKKSGVCAMSSDGVWMANKNLYLKNGFVIAETLGRFELMVKKLDDKKNTPGFFNWEKEQAKYKGWNLVYSDQCPWHKKSVHDLIDSAQKNGIDLRVTQLMSPVQAQMAPSGFGTFSLIKDGKLLEDHYLSKTRFENILKQQA